MKTKLITSLLLIFITSTISCNKEQPSRDNFSNLFKETFAKEAIIQSNIFKNAVSSIETTSNDATSFYNVRTFIENQYSKMDKKYLNTYNELINYPLSPNKNFNASLHSIQTIKKYQHKSESLTKEEIREIVDVALNELTYSEYFSGDLPNLTQNSKDILMEFSLKLKTELSDLAIELSDIEPIEYDINEKLETKLIGVVDNICQRVSSDKNIVGQERDIIESGLLQCELLIPSMISLSNTQNNSNLTKGWLKNVIKAVVRSVLFVVGGFTGCLVGVAATAWLGSTTGAIGGAIGAIAGIQAGELIYFKLIDNW